MCTQPTVFVVDVDHETRDQIRRLAATMNLHCETFTSGREFLEAYDGGCPGCLILEIRIPEINGLQIQEHLAAAGKDTPVIFLTDHDAVSIAVRAMRNGALNFLEKPIRHHELWDAIEEAVEVDRYKRQVRRERERYRQAMEGLDPKERKILEMVALGRSKHAIAAELQVCVRTVEMKRSRLMKKLGTKSPLELVQFALVACNGSSAREGARPKW